MEKCVSEWSELLANWATVLGVLGALGLFLRDRHAAQQAREQETYKTLHEEYLAFLRLDLERPELKLKQEWAEVPDELQWPRLVAFEILVSIFECAYFFYDPPNKPASSVELVWQFWRRLFVGGHRRTFRTRQWHGWESYMKRWFARRDFRRAWEESLSSELDEQFLGYVQVLLASQGSPGPSA
jgi:hypothetical protein